MQDVFTPAELKRLMEDGAGPRVSIYMPTRRSGAGYKENRTRLKNMLKEAEERLGRQGVENPEVMTERAKSLVDDTAFWEGRGDGLALFLSEDTFEYYRLPMSFEELVVVSSRFHIKPLVGFLADSGQFFLLCLSQSELKLYQAGRYSMREMDLGDDVPSSLEEAMRFDETEYQLQFHSGTSGVSQAGGDRRKAMYHGQGAGVDETKDQIKRFFQQVARGLNKILPDQQSPLVLAGMDQLCAIYREVNGYPKLMDDWVSGNYKDLSEDELLKRAWKIAEPYFRQGREAAVEKFGNLLGTGLTSSEVEEIVPAAFQGRLEALFVPVGMQVWGDFDQANGEAHVHEERETGDFDLLDFAAGQAMANGAAVYAVAPEEVPGGAIMAAVFRY
jgi:hypothetical protein